MEKYHKVLMEHLEMSTIKDIDTNKIVKVKNTNNPRLFHYMPETKLAWVTADDVDGTGQNTTITAGWKTSKLEIEKAVKLLGLPAK